MACVIDKPIAACTQTHGHTCHISTSHKDITGSQRWPTVWTKEHAVHDLLTPKITNIRLFELSKTKAEIPNKAAASRHMQRLDTSVKHSVVS